MKPSNSGKNNVKAKRESAIVMLSGGIDSTVAFYWALKSFEKIIGLEVTYKGRPPIESERIKCIVAPFSTEVYQVQNPIITLNGKEEFVKERNTLYYAVAGEIASKRKIKVIISGQIQDDWKHFHAPEATPEFYKTLNSLLQFEFGAFSPAVITPFIDMTKLEVVQLGKKLKVPFELTYSCDKNPGPEPCGACYQCITRRDVLNQLGR